MRAEGQSQRKLKAFISYSRDDLDFADQLDAVLDGSGFEAIIDRHGISAADDWRQRLGELIRDADSIVFVLSPSSASSDICRWEVEEATRLAKRIVPVVNRPLSGVAPPRQLTDLNYIHFYTEPKVPQSGFGTGLLKLIDALNEDPVWIREHTRLLALAHQWSEAGRPAGRLLSGEDIAAANAWLNAPRRSKTAPTALHVEYIQASEATAKVRLSETKRQLEEREGLVRQAEAALQQAAVAQRWRTQMRNVLLAVMSLATVVAGLLGYMANEQRNRSDQFRKDAQLTQSKFLANVATVDFDKEGSLTPTAAALYALEALPDTKATEPERRDRPAWPRADRALSNALDALREEAVIDIGVPVKGKPVELPDGRIAIRSDDNAVRIVDLTGAQDVIVLSGHLGPVTEMVLLKDGRLATGSDDKTIRLWPQFAKSEPVVLSGHEGPIQSLAALADGRLASGADDGTIRIWDVTTGRAAEVLKGYRGDNLVALRDGRIAGWLPSARMKRPAPKSEGESLPDWLSPEYRNVVGQEGDVLIWALGGKSEPDVLPGAGQWITSFCETNRHLIAGMADGTIRVWAKRDLTVNNYKAHGADVRAIWVRKNGLLVSVSGNSVKTWATDEPLKMLDEENSETRIESFAMLTDGSGNGLGRYSWIGFPEGALLRQSAFFSNDWIDDVSALSNHRLLSWTSKGQLTTWNLQPDKTKLRSLEGHTDRVYGLVQLDNDTLVSLSWDRSVRIWDWRAGKELGRLPSFDTHVVVIAALPHARVAAGFENGDIALCSAADAQCPRSLKGHTRSIAALVMLDVKTLVSSSNDGTVRFWDIESGKLTHMLDAKSGKALGLAPLPEKRLAVGGEDGKIRIWDIDRSNIIATFEGHNAEVDHLVALPDGRLVSSSADKTLKLWDQRGGNQVLEAFKGWIAQLRVLEDGRIAASGPEGLKVIDPSGVTLTLNLGGSFDSYYGLAPLPGRRLAAGYSNADIKFFDFPLFGQALIDEAKARLPRCLTKKERERQFLSPTPPAWCIELKKYPYRNPSPAASVAAK